LYNENIIINKSIILTSLALFDTNTNTIADTLEGWLEFSDIFGEYVVTNEFINTTIIDGSGNQKSVIMIAATEDLCIEPKILGFSIQNGQGTLVNRFYGNTSIQEYLGGGVFSYLANPTINYNKIYNNKSTTNIIKSGGGIYASSNSEDLDFDRHFNRDQFCESTTFDFKNNAYKNNFSHLGRHLGNRFYDGIFDLSGSIFDYWNCSGGGEYQTTTWINIDDIDDLFSENVLNSFCLQIQDVYVSPEMGHDELNNGLSWDAPFATITRAIAAIISSEINFINIYLDNGNYQSLLQSGTGEIYPLILPCHISLNGAGVEESIIDAQGSLSVILIEECDDMIIQNLTIKGGNNNLTDNGGFGSGFGGGIKMVSSSPIIHDVTIRENWAHVGGGLYATSSNPILRNVTIMNNQAQQGGGIRLWLSNAYLTNVNIINNQASQWGGGMDILYSEPTITNVNLSSNSAPSGGGIYIDECQEFNLQNVIINDNSANLGGGIYFYNSSPNLTYSTIVGNDGGSIYLTSSSNPSMINSIIWDNTPSTFLGAGNINITYSDIQGGWQGEGNIDNDPLFTDPENDDDYTLQEGSPCIDSGYSNDWYYDLDMTSSDMGGYGGPFILPTFIAYNFGEVGDLGSIINWNLYNYRETPITINSFSFYTNNFYSNTDYPLTIEPLQSGEIVINCQPQELGEIVDNVNINSSDLVDEASILLTAIGVEENVLGGSLSGFLESATYLITNDIFIESDNTLIIDSGTKFLFEGEYSFTIEGIIKAEGTESDSIIFENSVSATITPWKGLTMLNQSNETILQYVRISGAKKVQGGGIYLNNSHPILSHVTISQNTSDMFGGGLAIWDSHPMLDHITIHGNSANDDGGGGITMVNSNVEITNAEITGNSSAGGGGGIRLYTNCSLLLENVVISNNVANGKGGGIYNLEFNYVKLNNATIMGNSANYGAGIYSYYGDMDINNTVITNNIANNTGGGIYINQEDNFSIISNSTITHNTATNASGAYILLADFQLINSIIWNDEITTVSGAVTIIYSDIQGGWQGEGNIDDDPLFTDPENDDYTLQVFSPCIDAGTADLNGNGGEDITDYYGSAPDMGAFEYISDYCESPLGDVTGDGEINILDLVQIANLILEISTPIFECAADYTQDGEINILDLVQIVNYILDN